jgi:acyl-[acyl-carrier-protein]-phospholipid O-acyltransferase/long-chain-fatty-acid--[acyl-carrier-protein] ligase
VVGLPDPQKGERLAVLHTSAQLSEAEIWERLNQTDLPKLWIPKREAIFRVEAIPKLGSGKTDLRGVKEQAKALAGPE